MRMFFAVAVAQALVATTLYFYTQRSECITANENSGVFCKETKF